ncbi:MAG: O-antigen ligase family protein [Bacteroidota bacterium]|nr:O-antigen ligase family protein [Bacteroidota bacterium]
MIKQPQNLRDKLILFGWIILAMSITGFLQGSSMLMGFLSILYFIDEAPLKKFLNQFKNAYTYVFFLPFLLAIAGMINTENQLVGWHYVEVSLSFVMFPFLANDFGRIKIPSKWKKLYLAFVSGVLLTFLICLIRGLIRFPEMQSPYIFFYTQFSGFIMAPNHLSNYVLFAIIPIVIELVQRKRESLPIKSVALLILMLILLIIFLILLSSKGALLILGLFAIYFFIYLGRHKILSWAVIIVFGLFSISASLIVINQTILKVRIMNMRIVFQPDRIDYTVPESTVTRLSALQASSDLISQNWYLGYGTGDVRDVLTKYYKSNQYIGAYKYGTNPHNQFLRSFLAWGISGFASLLFLFALLFRQAKIHKKAIIWLWTVIMFILFLTDDMISIHAGVIYFTMFSALFTFAIDKKIKT